MRRVDAFVAEDPSDLVDALEAADDEALEIELGRDAQLHDLIERVDFGNEGTRGGAAGDVKQRRRLDLVESPTVDEAPRFGDNLAAQHHRVANVLVHDEVHVALAVPFFDVLEAGPLVGQRRERLAENRERADVQGRLALLRAKHVAGHSGEVPAFDVLPVCEGLVSDVVAPHVELQAPRPVVQVGEDRLAHRSLGHDASGDAPVLGFRALTALEETVPLVQFGSRRVHVVTRLRERIATARTQSGQMVASGRYERCFGLA